MKKTIKILALVLTLALAVTLFAACSKAGTKSSLDTKIVGKWKADLSALSDMLGEEIPEGMDCLMTMEFNKNGKGEMVVKVSYQGTSIIDEKAGYKWSLDGDKLIVDMDDDADSTFMDFDDFGSEEEPVTVKIKGDKLTLSGDDEDEVMVFTRMK